MRNNYLGNRKGSGKAYGQEGFTKKEARDVDWIRFEGVCRMISAATGSHERCLSKE